METQHQLDQDDIPTLMGLIDEMEQEEKAAHSIQNSKEFETIISEAVRKYISLTNVHTKTTYS